jgi:uncharacterized membrane protein YhaH (DUF805 family)
MYLTWLLFSFQGRVNRLPFWLVTLALIPGLYLGGRLIADFADLPLRVGIDLAGAILLLPSLAVQAKRWHDRGKSAWWILINFIPIVGVIWMLIECGAREGTRGPNAFGKDPLAREADPGQSPDFGSGTTQGGGDRDV